MLTCPKCIKDLIRTHNVYGGFWYCSSCKGRAVSAALFRKTPLRDYIDLLWLRAKAGEGASGNMCPACSADMTEVAKSSDPKTPKLDICRPCKLVWFDPKEYEAMLVLPPPVSATPGISQEEREFLDLHEAELRRDLRPHEWSLESPSEGWKLLPALVGLPVEYHATAFEREPWVTRGLAAATLLIFFWGLRDLDALVSLFGWIPVQAWRYGGLTLLSSFLVHGGFFHALVNVYFLSTFGDNVEDYLGKMRFVFLLLAGTIAGALFYTLQGRSTPAPMLGCGPAISSIMTFYVLRFPTASMGLAVLLGRVRWFKLPAFEALIVWVLLQWAGARFHWADFSDAALASHLGGVGTGLVFWLFWRKL